MFRRSRTMGVPHHDLKLMPNLFIHANIHAIHVVQPSLPTLGTISHALKGHLHRLLHTPLRAQGSAEDFCSVQCTVAVFFFMNEIGSPWLLDFALWSRRSGMGQV